MKPSDIKKICVLGAGTMGAGIAQRAAQSGFDVSMRDIKDEFVQGGFDRITETLEEGVKRKKVTEEQKEAILGSIHGTTDLAKAAEGAGLVIEAVFEEMDVKKEVFGQLDEVCPPETILASNTSSLSISAMAKVTGRESNFAGLHFFYPAAINRLVEVIEGDGTSDETLDVLTGVSRLMGKVPIRCKDSPGFIVNRYFVPFLNEACRLVDEEVGNAATVDAAAIEAFGIGLGPFALMNVTGIPIAYHSQCSLHDALGDAYAPSSLLIKQFHQNEPWDLEGDVDPEGLEVARKRLLGCVFTIAGQLIDEGVCEPEAADLGATIGLRWGAGPFAMMNVMGTSEARYLAATWTQSLPPDVAKFLLPKALEELAANDQPWPLSSVVVEREGPVAVLRISRPAAMNALNSDVLQDIERALRDIEDDPDLMVAIITGEGNAFVAGADIREMVTKTPLEARDYTLLGHRVFKLIEDMGTVVIAAVNGYALGGGLELALACDIILASEKARLGLPEVGLGIHPGFGGTQRLPRLIGRAKAKELILTAEQFGAEEAERLGIVNHVYPPDRLLEEAKAMAGKIATKGPVAVRLAKRAINRGIETDLHTALDYEVKSVSLCFATEDRIEGLQAFVDRRKPEFKGK
jgi:enoyl-CoA hydratase/3-hydroxyacyl-CoA dehydrogenase